MAVQRVFHLLQGEARGLKRKEKEKNRQKAMKHRLSGLWLAVIVSLLLGTGILFWGQSTSATENSVAGTKSPAGDNAAGAENNIAGAEGNATGAEDNLAGRSVPEEVLGPLIQTTTPEEEYEGLVHLGLLQTDINESGDLSQSVRNVLPSVVRIQTGNFTGSGLILEVREDSLLIASNRHQLFSQEFSGIQLYGGEFVSGKRIFLSEEYDLGFVEADIRNLSYESRSRLRCIQTSEVCEKALTKGSRMFLVGSADGVACNIYQGTVADPWYYFDEFGSYMIYNYCMAKAGMSGGGTYDEHGHCIGMITGGYEDETASLPMALIREEWEKLEMRQNVGAEK